MKLISFNRILQHLCFWTFYAVVFYFNYKDPEPVRTSIIVTIVSLPYLVISTYLQLYYLIPKFLLRKKFIAYAVLTIVFAKLAVDISLIIYGFIVIPLRTGNPPAMNWKALWSITPNQIYPFYGILTICGFAASIKMLKKWYLENERNKKIEREKTMMELEMLKAQVHPHFLFNTLNNLYSLILTHSERAAMVVTHLSDLLRYMLYDCNEKEIPLNSEIELLKKYVELEKLRYGSRMDVSFVCDIRQQNLVIAPLLLLPFVENSFKHGMSEQIDQCWISMHVQTIENRFIFSLSNSTVGNKQLVISGGIGLQNIRKRLDLMYPGGYKLTNQEEADMYIVKLDMQLNRRDAPENIYMPAKPSIQPEPVI